VLVRRVWIAVAAIGRIVAREASRAVVDAVGVVDGVVAAEAVREKAAPLELPAAKATAIVSIRSSREIRLGLKARRAMPPSKATARTILAKVPTSNATPADNASRASIAIWANSGKHVSQERPVSRGNHASRESRVSRVRRESRRNRESRVQSSASRPNSVSQRRSARRISNVSRPRSVRRISSVSRLHSRSLRSRANGR
jgi:hypothetical protein